MDSQNNLSNPFTQSHKANDSTDIQPQSTNNQTTSTGRLSSHLVTSHASSPKLEKVSTEVLKQTRDLLSDLHSTSKKTLSILHSFFTVIGRSDTSQSTIDTLKSELAHLEQKIETAEKTLQELKKIYINSQQNTNKAELQKLISRLETSLLKLQSQKQQLESFTQSPHLSSLLEFRKDVINTLSNIPKSISTLHIENPSKFKEKVDHTKHEIEKLYVQLKEFNKHVQSDAEKAFLTSTIHILQQGIVELEQKIDGIQQKANKSPYNILLVGIRSKVQKKQKAALNELNTIKKELASLHNNIATSQQGKLSTKEQELLSQTIGIDSPYLSLLNNQANSSNTQEKLHHTSKKSLAILSKLSQKADNVQNDLEHKLLQCAQTFNNSLLHEKAESFRHDINELSKNIRLLKNELDKAKFDEHKSMLLAHIEFLEQQVNYLKERVRLFEDITKPEFSVCTEGIQNISTHLRAAKLKPEHAALRIHTAHQELYKIQDKVEQVSYTQALSDEAKDLLQSRVDCAEATLNAHKEQYLELNKKELQLFDDIMQGKHISSSESTNVISLFAKKFATALYSKERGTTIEPDAQTDIAFALLQRNSPTLFSAVQKNNEFISLQKQYISQIPDQETYNTNIEQASTALNQLFQIEKNRDNEGYLLFEAAQKIDMLTHPEVQNIAQSKLNKCVQQAQAFEIYGKRQDLLKQIMSNTTAPDKILKDSEKLRRLKIITSKLLAQCHIARNQNAKEPLEKLINFIEQDTFLKNTLLQDPLFKELYNHYSLKTGNSTFAKALDTELKKLEAIKDVTSNQFAEIIIELQKKFPYSDKELASQINDFINNNQNQISSLGARFNTCITELNSLKAGLFNNFRRRKLQREIEALAQIMTPLIKTLSLAYFLKTDPQKKLDTETLNEIGTPLAYVKNFPPLLKKECLPSLQYFQKLQLNPSDKNPKQLEQESKLFMLEGVFKLNQLASKMANMQNRAKNPKLQQLLEKASQAVTELTTKLSAKIPNNIAHVLNTSTENSVHQTYPTILNTFSEEEKAKMAETNMSVAEQIASQLSAITTEDFTSAISEFISNYASLFTDIHSLMRKEKYNLLDQSKQDDMREIERFLNLTLEQLCLKNLIQVTPNTMNTVRQQLIETYFQLKDINQAINVG